MLVIREINLLNNKKMITAINLAGIPLFILGLVIFSVPINQAVSLSISSSLDIFKFLISYLALYLVIILVHELIHAVYFWLFTKDKGQIKLGFKSGLAYATSPGSRYLWWQYLIIVLAPCLLLSSLLVAAFQVGWLGAGLYLLLAAAHLAGCAGDLWYAWLVARYGDQYYEDTTTGLRIWEKNKLPG
ncbi:hypothetical protein AWM75_08430 [Aerococcus urinaehominis]|uniref:Uncharacterized protein n=2 Tax=Aerococcus urinaehominis TaxID=128944 RepID=A0A0X8FMI2_9LACT|nr:DUF3267 domain-containing protein [Aerococcus urinaehominis]AMB99995.1 hypothetical protein AWM75_08430 [Aerococcus urinaehominis]